jgi:gliding motility-associated-like protein
VSEGIPITLTPNFSGEVYIVSLTDDEGCTQYFNDDVHIEVKQLPQLTLDETGICKGEPSFLLNSATPMGGVYFIDNEENTYFDVENLQIGSHDIRYEYTDTVTLCSNEIEKIITINAPPVADFLFSPQPTDINNPSILFRDNSSNDILNAVWDLGNGTIIYDESSFWHTYTDTAGTYTIRYYITNIYGCTDSVINQLTINPIYRTYIPSSFTPNNDSDNDYFYPSIIGGNNYNMKIYDRWGGIIYNEDNGKWNGTINNNLIINGVYAYSITVLDFKDKPFIYTGLITIY